MAYTKTTWADGDVITAEKLNNMEDGIAESQSGGGIRFINFTPDSNGQYQYETGLSLRDFMGAYIGQEDEDGVVGFFHINQGSLRKVTPIHMILVAVQDTTIGDPTQSTFGAFEFQYTPETGIIQILFPD